MTGPTRSSYSAKFSGRLSSAEGRRKPCSIRAVLPGPVAVVHAPDLGDGDVGFVDDRQEVLREVVEEGERRLAGLPAG